MNTALDDFEVRPTTSDEMGFCGLVGDLSEGIDYCSYNDDSILSELLHGSLNAWVQHRAQESAYAKARLEKLTGHPADYNYEAELFRLMELTGGWPVRYGEPVTPLKELPAGYRDMFIKAGKQDLIEKWSK